MFTTATQKLYFSIFLFFLCFDSFSQAEYEIPDTVYLKKFNQVFGTLASGRGDAADLVSYGSFEPVNGAFKFNYFTPLGNPSNKIVSFLNIAAGGAVIGDNIGVFFDESKFSSGVNINAKLHFMLNSFSNANSIHVSENEMQDIGRKIVSLDDEKQKAFSKTAITYDSVFIFNSYLKDSLKLSILRKSILSSMNKIKEYQSDTTKTLQIAEKILECYSVIKENIFDSIDAFRSKQKNLFYLQNRLQRLIDRNNALAVIDDAFFDKKKALDMSVSVKGFSLLWITLTGGIERKKYYAFIDSLAFHQQFSKQHYTRKSLGVELNFINDFGQKEKSPILTGSAKPHLHIGNFGLAYVRDNNINSLPTSELTDSRKYSSGDSSHSITTKYSVHPNMVEEYTGLRIYANYYYTFGKNRNLALHTFSDFEIRNTSEKPLNVTLGLVFGLKNKKAISVVNAEFYTKFRDIGRSLAISKGDVFNRTEVGLNFAIPITL